jgi:hypothetical protein
MKIRIKGNSLRYRLTRSDVDLFASKGLVREKINFGDAALHYDLRSSTGQQLSAAYQDSHITIFFPAAWIKEWISTDKTGYEYKLALKDNETLQLLVEKDFTCMDNTTEDQTDNYPNPLLKK